MNSEEKQGALTGITKALRTLPADTEGWVELAQLGPRLTAEGVDYRQYGFQKLRPFLSEFQEQLELREELPSEGKSPVFYLRLKARTDPSDSAMGAPVLSGAVKETLFAEIRKALSTAPADAAGWVELAQFGPRLTAEGVDYKQYGFQKLRPFLNAFEGRLDLREEIPGEGKTPVVYLRLKEKNLPGAGAGSVKVTAPVTSSGLKNEKIPSPEVKLSSWALIVPQRYTELAELALEEKWYYGTEAPERSDDLPILKSYLRYTFKRLCHENKVLIRTDPESHEEYATFNTGLVDNKYEYIYALLTKNNGSTRHYWFLRRFVVAGEDLGKTLVKVFNPLPRRADYFQGRIQNMLYDTTTGDLNCDYTHIILERVERLPLEFLQENCPADFLESDGITIDEVYSEGKNSPRGNRYFTSLSDQIRGNPKILNRLKNRIRDAVDLALKKVEWNYKTAIPTYFPTRNSGSLLLPLSLVDEDHVDLALVVERQPSGAYLGQTILPLSLAYCNSRLVTRPDSDWLRTDLVCAESADDNGDE